MGGYLKNAFHNIFCKRLRSALTIAGIGIGVLSVIVISAIGDLGKQTINAELNSIGIDGLAVSASSSTTQPVTLYTDQLGEIKKDQNVEDAMPLMVQGGSTTTRRTSSLWKFCTAGWSVKGISPAGKASVWWMKPMPRSFTGEKTSWARRWR